MSQPSRSIYLDANATTLPFAKAVDAMTLASQKAFANPGSIHGAGADAKQAYGNARRSIARQLDAAESQVVFTSGGTESINMSLIGRANKVDAEANGSTRQTIRFQCGEHPATVMCASHLRQRGWNAEECNVDSNGLIDFSALLNEKWQEDDIACFLLAHNETGVLQDEEGLREAISVLRSLRVWTHIDAVQAVGKISVRFNELGADSLSLASHKFHGPRGIGALLIRDRSMINPLLFGGGQEEGLRPGTQCVPLAVGMAAALNECRESADNENRIRDLRDAFEDSLTQLARDFEVDLQIHCQNTNRLPNTTFASFSGVDNQQMVLKLAEAGVFCSAGAACKSDAGGGSVILDAMGCGPAISASPVRFSMDCKITIEDIREAVARIGHVLQATRREPPQLKKSNSDSTPPLISQPRQRTVRDDFRSSSFFRR